MSDRNSDRPGSLTAKSKRGMGWLASSAMLLALARIAVIAVVARILTPAEFGLMAAAGIFIEFARLLSASGIVFPLVQRDSISQHDINTAFTANLISSFLATALLCLFAGTIADFFDMPKLREILYVCSLLFPLNGISEVSNKLLDRAHSFAIPAITEFVGFVIGNAAIALTLVLLGFGVWGLVAGQLATAAARSILLFRAQPYPIRLRINLASYRDLMRQGAAYSIQRLTSLVSQKGDYFVIAKMLDQTALGQYERGYVLMNMSNRLIMGPLNRVLFPAFARISNDHERMRRAYQRCTALIALLFLPVSAVCVVLGPEIIDVLLGDQWGMTVLPFQILAGGMFLRAGYKMSGIAMNGMGMVYRSTLSQGTYAFLVVGGAILLVRWGIVGVAVSTVVAIGAVYLLLTWSIISAIGLRIRDVAAGLMPPLALAGLTAAICWGVASLLRPAQAPSLLILACALVGAGIVIAGLVLIAPRILGRWSLETIAPAAASLQGLLRRRNMPAGWLGRLARHP